MELPNLFKICSPREDVLKRTISETDAVVEDLPLEKVGTAL